VAAVLAVAGLAGCKTNVGTAAMIDGHRITESDVNDYVSPEAQPVQEQSSTGTVIAVPPRSFVISELINEQLGLDLVRHVARFEGFTSAQLDARVTATLAGKTPTAEAESLGLKGFPERFYRVVLRVRELGNLLQQQSQAGTDVNKILTSLDFPVSVNPRYGSWDKKTYSFNASPSVPSYLSVAPQQQALPGTK
jgi:hypothetical protein